MDVSSELVVENVLKTPNRALFLTRFGGPITFHLQVGKDEEHLLKTTRKAIHAFGGRYFRRYHEMTPYTVLLVTDLGFKTQTFNRPAICLTYIGDCMHTNHLRNINNYIHPWDDLERWKKVDLFDVIYCHNRMFQCKSTYAPGDTYIPVSRSFKGKGVCEQKATKHEQKMLLDTSDDDDDLFNRNQKGESNEKAFSTVIDSDRGNRIAYPPLNEVTEENAENLDETHHETATCKDTDFVSEHSPTYGGQQDDLPQSDLSSQMATHRSCKTSYAGDPSSKLTNNPTKTGMSLKNPQEEISMSRRNPCLLLRRIPESLYKNKTVISGEDILKLAGMMSKPSVSREECSATSGDDGGVPEIIKKNLQRRCDDQLLQVGSRYNKLHVSKTSVNRFDKLKETKNGGDCLVERLPLESLGEIPPQGRKTPEGVENASSLKVVSVFSLSPKRSGTQFKKGRVNKHGLRGRVMKKSDVGAAEGASSASDGEYVATETLFMDLAQKEPSPSSQQVCVAQNAAQRQPPGASPSTSSLAVTPKVEFKEEEAFKRRGRGYQDRYRSYEKVAMLKWLVEHRKFRNLRGVNVWREMERKKVIPGRPHQSLKNQFLKHLIKNLDAYPFLTDEHKRKFREAPAPSSDDDFVYQGRVTH